MSDLCIEKFHCIIPWIRTLISCRAVCTRDRSCISTSVFTRGTLDWVLECEWTHASRWTDGTGCHCRQTV